MKDKKNIAIVHLFVARTINSIISFYVKGCVSHCIFLTTKSYYFCLKNEKYKFVTPLIVENRIFNT